jgi:hypothetical protein
VSWLSLRGKPMLASVVIVALGVLFYVMGRHYGLSSRERALTAALAGGCLYGLLGTAATGLPASAILPQFVVSALVIGSVVYTLEWLDQFLTDSAAKRAARKRLAKSHLVTAAAG